jgi:hypothetical protein
MTTPETHDPRPAPVEEPLLLLASNVTGNHELPIEVGRDLLAADVTASIVSLMSLPTDVPWALRDDGSSAYLDAERPIGEQVEPGARVTITPKAHLG